MNTLYGWLFQCRTLFEKYAAPISSFLALISLSFVSTGLYLEESIAKDCEASTSLEFASVLIYETAQVLLLNMEAHRGANELISIGRIFAVLFVIFLGIQAINSLLGDALTKAKLRIWTWWGGHVIVCGLGRLGWPIVQKKIADGYRVIVIEKNPDNERTDDAKRLGAIVLIGDATEERLLEELRAPAALELFMTTGQDSENIETLVDLRAMIPASRSPKLWIHFDDELLRRTAKPSWNDNPHIIDLNAPLEIAYELIIGDLTSARPARDQVALYVVFGFHDFGRTLVRQLAELAHFDNLKRSRILILSEDPGQAADEFLSMHGRFAPRIVETDWDKVAFDADCDDWSSRKHRLQPPYAVEEGKAVEYACNAIFALLPSSLSDGKFLQMLGRCLNAENVKPVALFCHEQDQLNFHQSIALHAELGRSLPKFQLPIFAWLSRSEPLSRMMTSMNAARSQETPPFPKSFGSYADCALRLIENDGESTQALAIFAAYHQLDHKHPEMKRQLQSRFIKDNQDYKHSNLMADKHFAIKIACLGLQVVDKNLPGDAVSLAEIELDTIVGHMEHNRWMAERLMKGYFYGTARVTFPLSRITMVPHAELPAEEKAKDTEPFVALWNEIASKRKFVRVKAATETQPSPATS